MTTTITTAPRATRPAGWLGQLTGTMRTRRDSRARRRDLERLLASYTTPAEILELNAILERSDAQDPEVTEIVDRIRRCA